MVIAQISDTHIRPEGVLAYGRIDTAPYLVRAVQHLLGLKPRPDVVLATGDLVDAGSATEYARLRALLAPLPMPVYLIPGNHDDRGALVGAFPEHQYLRRGGRFIQYVVEDFPVRLVALDTLVPGKHSGLLCEERLGWLAARLTEAPDRPTVIFMHHAPFDTGIEPMDRYGLDGSREFIEVVARHPQVERVLCGHVHRPIQARIAGTVVSTAPSTAHQVELDLEKGRPLMFTMEPPACQLHVWRPGAGLVSHTSYIGDYDGPYRFSDGGKVVR